MAIVDTPWVDGLTIGEALYRTVRDHGSRDAVVFPRLNLRWSYDEFFDRVKQTARAFMALDIEAGDHIGIWSTNWPEWILAQFASAHIGAVLVNVNPAYRVHEMEFILGAADIKLLLLTDAFKHSNYEDMIASLIPELETAPFGKPLALERFPSLRQVVGIKAAPSKPGIWPWEEFTAQARRIPESDMARRAAACNFQMPANIQYTSGTTGQPKGAVLTHRNLLMNAFHVGGRQRMGSADRLCIPVPFYHCFGCVMGTLMCAVHGAAMIVPAESFEPESVLDAVEKERCTALYGVPTMFNAELNHPDFDQYDLSTLRTGIMAGSPCPIELMKQVTHFMHLSELTIAYGLTESSPVITQSETSEPIEVRVSTVGTVLPGVEVRIVDPKTLNDMPDGEPGELWSRGHGTMLGYYKDPDATAKVVTPDGWLRTGDLAVRTPSGHYRITGRIKDMIIRGGENIYPREIEEFLLTHPKIYDAQIVGVPDVHYGEQVSAWIIPKDPSLTEEEIRAFCKGNIAHYKIPHYIEFVREFPLTVSGKIQKFKLREAGIERFHLQQAAGTETA